MINDQWLETWDKMGQADRGQMGRCISGLLAHTYLLSEQYDDADGVLKGNSDYRLVDRHFDWVRDHLSVSGWDLVKDRTLGVIYVENLHNRNRLQLGGMTTLILLALRLLYDEEREKLVLRNVVAITTWDVANRLMVFNALKRKPSDKDLSEALRILARHNLIQKMHGNWQEPDCRFLIHPSILLVLPGDAITRIWQGLQAGDEDLDQMALTEADTELAEEVDDVAEDEA
jgi:hypothetical protein